MRALALPGALSKRVRRPPLRRLTVPPDGGPYRAIGGRHAAERAATRHARIKAALRGGAAAPRQARAGLPARQCSRAGHGRPDGDGAGVSVRSLYAGFKEYCGVSPLQYLRMLRLDGARQALLNAPDCHIASIAMHWGFGHLGRFSMEYKERFGESPSQSVRRR
ncbi:MAG: helix-turn-helix transcriptional regulator [Telluria sp.]